MYTQVKSKKGISVIIGYVLLITFAVVIGAIIYQWMKTYVPQEELNCPDGASIFIEDYSYDCASNLTLYLKNNGKFDLGGYIIYATNSPGIDVATIDLSQNNTNKSLILQPTGIKFNEIENNSLNSGEIKREEYNLAGIGKIYSIEILPIRWQVEKNKKILTNCKDAKIREIIQCK